MEFYPGSWHVLRYDVGGGNLKSFYVLHLVNLDLSLIEAHWSSSDT